MNEVNSPFSHFRLISSRKLFMGKASLKPNDVLLSDLLTDVQSGAALSLVLKDARLSSKIQKKFKDYILLEICGVVITQLHQNLVLNLETNGNHVDSRLINIGVSGLQRWSLC